MLRLCLLAVCFLRIYAAGAAVLRDFQVAQPATVPHDAKQCTIKVLQRDFAFSFGSAEVVELTPPIDCGPLGSWAAITLNLTVTSNGTQFDRLAHFTFQNVEIWRTSTPEPTRGDGIIWTYIKDVSQYMPLFAKPGTFIFQLDNLIQPGLDGIYSTTVHATFYASSNRHPAAKKADLIIPLSTLANNTGNEASVPPSFSRNVTLPTNTLQVYAELFASGNGQEEFWYFNAANAFLPSLPAGTTFGQGPFREVRLLIDGKLAGVVLPYPVVFTGGFIPSFWRPITSYGAMDLPTYFVDVTPFVPLLVDGNPHQFTIDVVSAEADHTILQNWYVSGLLQVITDSSPEPTSGNITVYDAPLFAQATNTGTVRNGSVDITVTASHKLHVEASILSGSGKSIHAVWTQELSYSNHQTYTENATVQVLRQTATGRTYATHNGVPSVADVFSYPLNVDFAYLAQDQRNWTTRIDHSYERAVLPNPLIVGSTIKERQITDGFYQLATGGNFGNGTSNNTFAYADIAGNTYAREVNAALNIITLDREGGSLARTGPTGESGSIFQVPLDSVYGAVRLPGGQNL
ncbi:putative peptide N-acetyl-beta-D-glucosaminyl asparaginase amidase A [Lyophyllum shimeji]|uniref:Peptide N-acetyl-beta-D-glucosaminyl asparaginase amidase A n=1 Tax=Lyophyllum shimeji TaxID=47721 RepID=A0A9P3PGB4_LYOSH|nr:putative peptide N-acetyl-beta-D-glucosaminyl asparaginase amidase A [Lyophyllum shimeji]